MDLIISYEDKLEKNEGAFIDQNGKIIFTYGEHEKYAKDFCDGKNNQLLTYVNMAQASHIMLLILRNLKKIIILMVKEKILMFMHHQS